MKILIIEDNHITRMVFQKLVRTLGYTVTTCNTAESALQLCLEQFFPLIILDLGLPGIDGFEFCRRLRSRPQEKYSMILVVTALDRPEDLQEALEAGADDYIVKPVEIELLQMRLTIMERRALKLHPHHGINANTNQPVLPLEQAVANFEKHYLETALYAYQWQTGQVAAALQIDPDTLDRKMQRYHLTKET